MPETSLGKLVRSVPRELETATSEPASSTSSSRLLMKTELRLRTEAQTVALDDTNHYKCHISRRLNNSQ